MKTCIKIALASLVAVAALASCHRQEVEPVEWRTELQVVSSDLVFSPVGGSGTAVLNLSGASVTSNASWCQASVSGETVSVTVGAWGGLESRYAVVTVSRGGESLNIPVMQYGVNLGGVAIDSELSIPGDGGEYSFPCASNADIAVSPSADWITTVLADGELKVTCTANPVKSVRFGTITLAIGEVVKEVTVMQYPVFENTPDWKVTYSGDAMSGSTLYSTLTNTVTADLGLYTLDCITPADFASFGLSEADFVRDVLAPSMAASIREAVEYYASYGYDYPFSAFLLSGSDWDYVSKLEEGKYIGFAVGFDEDGYPTGWYTADAFEVGKLTPYQMWLGKWNVTCHDATNEWLIEEKEADKSFWISGVGGFAADTNAEGAFRAEAGFDAETNQLVLRVFDNTSATWTDANRGEMHAILSGFYTNTAGSTYYTSTSGAEIARATISSDGSSASLEGSKTSDGFTYHSILWLGRYVNASTGRWSAVSWTNRDTSIPQTITKVE